MSTLRYKREIDGLRAIAVTLVLLNHAKIELFSGGYIGVDIFFVISGYLITGIITRQISDNSFSLREFYKRRVRRIFPALFVVMLCCIPLAWKSMSEVEFDEFTLSLNAVSFFVSNIFYMFQSGYFDLGADQRPLLHTWSLAIEEQFYIVFPLLVMLIMRRWNARLMDILIALFVVSLLVCEIFSYSRPVMNFYATYSRAWELIAGALLAVCLVRFPAGERLSLNICQVISLAGLGLIFAAAFGFSETTRFPSLWTLLPVVGAACIIGFARPGTLVGWILSSKPFVAIGLISYSLYLWHQPVFVFARLYSPETLEFWDYQLLIGITLLLSWASWRYVEQPFRHGQVKSFMRPVAGIAALFVAVTGFGVVAQVLSLNDYEKRFNFTRVELDRVRPANSNQDAEKCDWRYPVVGDDRIRTCAFGQAEADKTMILVGDSHAISLMTALGERLKKANWSGVFLENNHCKSIPGVFPTKHATHKRVQRCQASFAPIEHYIKSQNPGALVVAMRWTFQLYPIPGEIESVDFDNEEGGVGPETYREYFALNPAGNFVTDAAAKTLAIAKFLGFLSGAVPKLVVVYPVPEVGWSPPEVNLKSLLLAEGSANDITTNYELYLKRHRYILPTLNAQQKRLNFTPIQPSKVLCNVQAPGRCVAQVNGVPLYSDDDHLSNVGARIVVGQIFDDLGIKFFE